MKKKINYPAKRKKSGKVNCPICEKVISSMGLGPHVRLAHQLVITEIGLESVKPGRSGSRQDNIPASGQPSVAIPVEKEDINSGIVNEMHESGIANSALEEEQEQVRCYGCREMIPGKPVMKYMLFENVFANDSPWKPFCDDACCQNCLIDKSVRLFGCSYLRPIK